MKGFGSTVRKIEYHDVGSLRMIAEGFRDKHPWEYTKQALITFEKAP
jgi:hypothetical protein